MARPRNWRKLQFNPWIDDKNKLPELKFGSHRFAIIDGEGHVMATGTEAVCVEKLRDVWGAGYRIVPHNGKRRAA